jgi:ABC-type phosphate transport system substrate-binding protein
LMESRFHEYADNYSDYIPMHFNSTSIQTTNYLCNGVNPKGNSPLIGAASSTAAGRYTTNLANYSESGMSDCDSTNARLIEVPIARMPASIMIDPNTATHQCLNSTGGLSMGQMRWILSNAPQSTLTSSAIHPGVVWNSVVPNDDGDGEPEWRDLSSSCPDEPIHIYHRWENRSVPQMISSFMFCDHCSFPEDWFESDNTPSGRQRIIQETREEIISGSSNNDDVIGITELRAAITSNEVYHVPLFDNWTHGAADALAAGNLPIHPSVENSTSGVWPFQDDYRLVIREDDLDILRPFLAWMLSEEGQDNFDEIGFVRMDSLSRVHAGDRIGINLRHLLPDDDGDGIWNGDDNCTDTAAGLSVDASGCAQNQLDDDGDGLVNTEDDCPYSAGTSTHPTVGCPDVDGDGWADTADSFPSEPSQWNDTDADGFGDESGGYQADACPLEYGLSVQDRYGCLDTDGDGWSDLNDMFPGNPSQWVDNDGDGVGDNYTWGNVINGIRVSEYGDAFPSDITQDKDRDGDGFGDNSDGFLADDCPDSAGSSDMGGRIGCPDSDGDGWADVDDAFPDEPTQHSDLDGDGYGDSISGNLGDNCQETPPEEITLVDGLGCAPSERDSDYDGVSDADDLCLNTPETELLDVDSNGCSESERDTDGDGAIDSVDQYPSDPTQTVDTDGDGFGNNPDGTNGDDCPNEAGSSTGNLRGCIDSDGDDWADVEDIVPNINTQWKDSDGDGYYDNYANTLWTDDEMRVNLSWPGQLVPGARTPDRCPLHANSLQNLENPGCPDDIHPNGEDSSGNTNSNIPITTDSEGGLSATVWIIIAAVVVLLIAIGGGMTLVLKKPKKKQKKRSIVRPSDEPVAEVSVEAEDELSPEDDPNYKVDENGCEWWYDQGAWWYRTPDMEEWTEYDS